MAINFGPFEQGNVRFAPKTRNFFKYILTNPCARPWYLYAETFTAAFIKMVVTVIIFDLEDVMRAAAVQRSKPHIGPRRGRRRHAARPLLPDDSTPERRVARQGLRFVIKITMPLERIGFAWLLYAATEQFYYDWQSLLESSRFCDAPINSGPFSRTDPAGQVLSRPSGQGFGYNELEQNRPGWSNNALSVLIPENTITIVATLRVRRNFSDLAGVQLGLETSAGGVLKEFRSGAETIKTGVWTDLIVTGSRRAGIGQHVSVVWVIFGPASATGMETDGGDVFIMTDN